jgi:hypothetical protein
MGGRDGDTEETADDRPADAASVQVVRANERTDTWRGAAQPAAQYSAFAAALRAGTKAAAVIRADNSEYAVVAGDAAAMMPPLTEPLPTLLWTDWPADDLVVLVCPSGAHEGKISQGVALGNYSTNAFRAGGRWCCVVPSSTVPYFTTGAAGFSVAPDELQSARPPD